MPVHRTYTSQPTPSPSRRQHDDIFQNRCLYTGSWLPHRRCASGSTSCSEQSPSYNGYRCHIQGSQELLAALLAQGVPMARAQYTGIYQATIDRGVPKFSWSVMPTGGCWLISESWCHVHIAFLRPVSPGGLPDNSPRYDPHRVAYLCEPDCMLPVALRGRWLPSHICFPSGS